MSTQVTEERSLGRVLGFSDGVYAIAITLLVLTIQIPENIRFTSNADVLRVIIDLLPQFYAYTLSFAIIGLNWMVHHKMFRSITRSDDTLLFLNLFNLFCISFIPVPTMLLSRAGDTSLGAILYASWMVLISVSFRLLWNYATKQHHLVEKSLSREEIRYSNLRGFISMGAFLLSIPVALFSPVAAEAIWVASLFLRPKLVEKMMGWKSR